MLTIGTIGQALTGGGSISASFLGGISQGSARGAQDSASSVYCRVTTCGVVSITQA